MAHKFDAKKVEILDSIDRRKFLNPDSILKKAGVSGYWKGWKQESIIICWYL